MGLVLARNGLFVQKNGIIDIITLDKRDRLLNVCIVKCQAESRVTCGGLL